MYNNCVCVCVSVGEKSPPLRVKCISDYHSLPMKLHKTDSQTQGVLVLIVCDKLFAQNRNATPPASACAEQHPVFFFSFHKKKIETFLLCAVNFFFLQRFFLKAPHYTNFQIFSFHPELQWSCFAWLVIQKTVLSYGSTTYLALCLYLPALWQHKGLISPHQNLI